MHRVGAQADIQDRRAIAPGLQDQFHRIEAREDDQICVLHAGRFQRSAGENADEMRISIRDHALGFISNQRRATERRDQSA